METVLESVKMRASHFRRFRRLSFIIGIFAASGRHPASALRRSSRMVSFVIGECPAMGDLATVLPFRDRPGDARVDFFLLSVARRAFKWRPAASSLRCRRCGAGAGNGGDAGGGQSNILLAFGPSRHRACFLGLRPLVCGLGSRGWPLGVFWEAVWRPLGGCIFGPLGPRPRHACGL